MSDLLPCPFCGGQAVLTTSRETSDGPGVSSVRCDTCGAQGGTPRLYFWRCAHGGVTRAQGEALHDAEAVQLWNRRA